MRTKTFIYEIKKTHFEKTLHAIKQIHKKKYKEFGTFVPFKMKWNDLENYRKCINQNNKVQATSKKNLNSILSAAAIHLQSPGNVYASRRPFQRMV
jgi:deoxyribodipyrimidine photolyase